MTRRRNNGLTAFFDSFNRGYDTVNKVSRDFETQDIMKEDATETQNYSPEEVKQIEVNVAAGKENPYEGVGMSGTKFTYNGKSFDAKPSDVQLDGLRAARLADVAQKYGDHEGAMRLRRDARQAKEEDRVAQMRDATDAERKRYQDALKDPRKFALEAYKANEGIGGQGDHKDRSIDAVEMPNGMLRITQYDKDNNPLGYKDMKAEDLDGIAKDFLFKNHILNLSAIDGDRWNTLAYQMGKDDKHMRMILEDRDYKRGRDKVSDDQWGKTFDQKVEHQKWFEKHGDAQLGLQRADIAERRAERADARAVAAAKEVRERVEKGGDKVQKFAMDNIPELWSVDADGKQRLDEKGAREFNDFIQRTGGIQVGDKKVPWDVAMANAPAETKAAMRNQFALYYLNRERDKATGQQHPDADVRGVRESRDSDWGIGHNSGLSFGAGLGKKVVGGNVIELGDGTVIDYEALMRTPYGPMVRSYLKANKLLPEAAEKKPSLNDATPYVPLPGEVAFFP